VRHDVGIERDQTDPIPLLVHQVCQAPGEHLPVLDFADTAAAEPHRLRHVEQHRKIRVGIRLVLLDIEAVGPRVESPVDAADIVAGDISAVLRKIYRRAEVRRTVHAVDEPVDNMPRNQLEIADARQHGGIDEPRAGDGRGR